MRTVTIILLICLMVYHALAKVRQELIIIFERNHFVEILYSPGVQSLYFATNHLLPL